MNRIEAAWHERVRVPPRFYDAALAAVLTILVPLESSAQRWHSFNPLELLMTVPLLWRRRYPLPVFGLVVVGAVVGAADAPYTGLTAVMVAAYSVGAYFPYRFIALAVLLVTATAIHIMFDNVLPDVPPAIGPYLILIPLWLIGQAIRTRQLRADLFEDRATRLEREREAAMRAAAAAERTRIARELHDVVAHSVSVMVVQAGAARHIVEMAPEQAVEALRAVETTGHEAMADLRNLLGVLDQNDDGPDLAPQPGVEQLQALVQRIREAGLPVVLRVQGNPRPLPAGLNLTIYRIVQEALTNALKYAAGARTEVVLDYRDAEIKVEVLDDGPGRCDDTANGTGHGLVGMGERVALYGGRLEAGPRLERGYAVRAWLPLRADFTPRP